MEKPVLLDSLTICFTTYVWKSWFNLLAIKNKTAAFRKSFLAFEISYLYSKSREPKHPGDDVTINYNVQVAGGWHGLHSERTSLAVWKPACISANLVTGLLHFSNGKISKDINIAELANSAAQLTADWNVSHVWSMAETVSQMNVFTGFLTRARCGEAGDLIAWTSPFWTFDTRFPGLATRKEDDLDHVCGRGPTTVTLTLPVQPTFRGAVNMCKLLGEGNVTAYSSFPEWEEALKKAREDIGPMLNMWFSLERINGSFVSYYSREAVSNIIWRPGSPQGLYDCVYCQETGCADRDCKSDHVANFQCRFTQRPVLFLKGLCAGSNLDRGYYPDNRQAQFIWVGVEGTFIRYNQSMNAWVAKVRNLNTWASIETSLDSLLLGTHEWTIHNDHRCFPGPSKKMLINLSFCSNQMFSCDDGSCVNLKMRCDENIDCPDGTDEVGCKIVRFPESYNKAVTSNNEKSDLNTSVVIHNILSIDEIEGNIRLTVRLILEWHDSRLTFLDLNTNPDFNVLEDNEFSDIWKPELIFINVEQKDFEYSIKPHIRISMDASEIFNFADYTSVSSAKLYPGNTSIIRWYSEFRYHTLQYVLPY